ncbi:hypothetical protein pEaSNUABM37_00119 [Erwinia phage pEa_SNUABM_37]|nr:hypothetical protein pEaSNUABM37_00119 [Erwinia phage pEa_SNUABM_37]QXO10589.1 hypothetical protein pEaSNUABM48_00119 [Erwinia phage pEa_SNUABM_48]
MFNYVSQDQFNVLKRRWEIELAEGCPSIDPRLVESLKAFNALPGVVSIWSCSGHTKAEQEADNEKFEERQDRNIIFAIRPGSENLFAAFAAWSEVQEHSEWSLTRPVMSTFNLVWCFKEHPDGTITIDDIGGLYSAWKLNMSYYEHEDLPFYMSQQWDYLINFLGDYHQGVTNARSQHV